MIPRFRMADVDAGWFDENVPCTRACPVLTNAGRYVSAIAEGNDELAYLTARLPNPFPSICGRVCAAPCELACRRGVIDEPIAIRALKRFACEHGGVESEAGERLWHQAVNAMPPRGERVAIVGAGPAGLACAHDLAAYGYQPVVFEAQDRPGGMMVLGIPTYRLRRDVLEAEIRAILGLGVELRTGVRLGADFSLGSLKHDGFGAVFVGVGALRSRDLQIPGVETDGVLRAVEFLINANLGYRVDLGERVVVIGGGNVALDAARTALRDLSSGGSESRAGAPADRAVDGVGAAATAALDAARVARRMGAREVVVVALESREEMPAHGFEIEEAEREGVRILHRLGPVRVVGNGHVQGLETLRVASVFDPQGRFDPRFEEGTESVIPCDSVIMAIGQAPDLDWLRPDDGVGVSPRGTIAIDRDTLATSASGVYAGGDVAFGPRNLIDAIADGRRAAASIHLHLSGEALPRPHTRRRPIPLEVIRRPVLDYDAVPRQPVPSEPSGRRIGAAEVELGYTHEQARLEAARCLQCFLNIWLDVDLCILCGGCVDICPEDCLRIVPGEDLLGAVASEGPSSALILQEDRCIRCALCIERCPTDALSMVDWKEASTAVPSTPMAPSPAVA
jgi:formate dehydrogenase (NADP+) beta subunit